MKKRSGSFRVNRGRLGAAKGKRGFAFLDSMRVDTCQELDPGDATLELPWTDPTESSRRYVDLKKRPSAVAELEECCHFPPLGKLLSRVNSPASVCRTAKCDVWFTTELAEDEERDFGLPCKVASYVDLLFDHADLNSRIEPHLQLATEIEQGLRDVRVPGQLEVFVRRCLFHPDERWGYYFTIYAHAYGANPKEAKSHWERAIVALSNVLAKIEHLHMRDAGGFLA